MSIQTATLIGATGLIGNHLLHLLLEDSAIATLKVLVRRPVAIVHPKVQLIQLDFGDEAAYRAAIAGSDVVFCTVGTTLKQVNSDMDAYRKIDYDIPVNAARFVVETKCPQLILVSSVGAYSQSSNFYLKLKGEVEDQMHALGLPSASIFRPSMLMGQRTQFRLGERIGQVLMGALAFLIPAQYKPIAAAEVAQAMLVAAKMHKPGVHRYDYTGIKQLLATVGR